MSFGIDFGPRTTGLRDLESQIVSLVAQARTEGWYEDDPGWSEVDRLLELRRQHPGGV